MKNENDTKLGERFATPDQLHDQMADSDDSDTIISAIREIISADMTMLETHPAHEMISARAEARLRASLNRLTGGTDTPPTVLEALVLEALDPLLRDWLERNMAPLVERLVEGEIRRIMSQGRRAKHLEADDALV